MSLEPFFRWMAGLAISSALQNSVWLGAVLNLMHLLSMAVFAGAVLLVDLRLLRRGLTQQPLAQIARSAQPWLIGGFLGLLITGIPAVLSTAMRQYETPLFWYKMYFLLAGLIFTFTVRRSVTQANEARVRPIWAKLVAITSVAIWAIVAASARMIMLY